MGNPHYPYSWPRRIVFLVSWPSLAGFRPSLVSSRTRARRSTSFYIGINIPMAVACLLCPALPCPASRLARLAWPCAFLSNDTSPYLTTPRYTFIHLSIPLEGSYDGYVNIPQLHSSDTIRYDTFWFSFLRCLLLLTYHVQLCFYFFLFCFVH